MNQNTIILLVALLTATISNAGGNFLYQKLSRKNDWGMAAERTFFQSIAIVTVGLNYALLSLI